MRGNRGGSQKDPPSELEDTPAVPTDKECAEGKTSTMESTPEGVTPVKKNVTQPSILSNKALRLKDLQWTILDKSGAKMAELKVHWSDIHKEEARGVIKCKELPTPDPNNRGAAAPKCKRVKFEGATF